jgi:hypothetical protein
MSEKKRRIFDKQKMLLAVVLLFHYMECYFMFKGRAESRPLSTRLPACYRSGRTPRDKRIADLQQGCLLIGGRDACFHRAESACFLERRFLEWITNGHRLTPFAKTPHEIEQTGGRIP